jgi:hypothetical protein
MEGIIPEYVNLQKGMPETRSIEEALLRSPPKFTKSDCHRNSGITGAGKI